MSSTSLEVSPWWIQRPAGPAEADSTSTNAAVSWSVTFSRSSISSTVNVAARIASSSVGGRAVHLLARGDLDLAHRLEVRVVGPDVGQLGTGVARDHHLRAYPRYWTAPDEREPQPRRRLASARSASSRRSTARRRPTASASPPSRSRARLRRARMPSRRSRRSAPTAATGGRSASSTRSRPPAAVLALPQANAPGDPRGHRGRRRRRRRRPVGRPRPRPALVPPRGAAAPVDVERGRGGRRPRRRADVRADRAPRCRPLGPDLPPDLPRIPLKLAPRLHRDAPAAASRCCTRSGSGR